MLEAIKQGNPLPLNLQLFDGKTDRIVKASGVDSAGNVLFSNVVMSHVQLGLYQNSAQLMPLVDAVVVTYIVYTPLSVEDTSYSRSQDIFLRAKDADDSEIVGTVEDLNELIGKVVES